MESNNKRSLYNIRFIDLTVVVSRMFKGLQKFWKLLLLVFLLSVGVVFLWKLQGYSASYQAYVTVAVAPKNVYGIPGENYDASDLASTESAFSYIVSGTDFAQEVASALGYESSLPASIGASVPDGSAELLITVDSVNPTLAYNALDVVLEKLPEAVQGELGNLSFTVVSSSGIPTRANTPSYIRILILGVLTGILVCTGILAVYGVTRFTVMRRSDVSYYFGVSCFGCVPVVKAKKKKTATVLQSRNRKFIDAFRTVCNGVMRLGEENKKCFVVTSAEPGEGSTTVAVNLALALAQKQERVVLVDANFHNPGVASALKLKPRDLDVAAVLSDGKLRDEDFQPYPDLELYVLCGKASAPDQLVFLDMPYVKAYLKKLRKQCDYIIIDTASCGEFVDALELGRCADGVILTVQQDGCSMYQVRYALEQLEGVGAFVDGYVVNQFSKGISGPTPQ